MTENNLLVSRGFRILLGGFAPYIARELSNEYGAQNWWTEGVLNILYDEQKRDLPQSGEWAKLVDSLDIACCLRLFDLHWSRIFRKKLSIDHRTWAKELMGTRNRLAHIGGEDFSDDDTWRALDTMSRLSDQLDPETAEEIRGILREFRYGSNLGSTAVTETSAVPAARKKKFGILETMPASGLPSWREVIQPHPDVAQGRYKNAEFAADLAQVARGEGAFEYLDPVEFFARTYVTEGMSGLLEQALRRICGKDGEPVIQLKTAFGGGKTHSMLALYHLLRGRVSIEKIPTLKPTLRRAEAASLPKANVAVLVGTALDPARSKRPQNMPGITINTIWGEMAAQLVESAQNLKLYDYVKEADKKGVSPGSEALTNLFNACGPCLILMDELVAYAKKLYGAQGLPAGTFDNFISFIQEVTEAARASKNSLVVASIPESDIEIGGEAGKTALEAIEHTFGRMESIWKPVAANEGFEVVRRRLFLDCKNPDKKEAVCTAFSRMYAENAGDFPMEAKEVEYRERMVSCYPIHPEVFDRLYEDWATLERFQRTRGVLRLMASVIHELWMGNDAGLLIMPSSIPMDVPTVRDELTRHLPEGWNALVDREVDGRGSIPFQKDQANQRYGARLAARRVARTIMLGSAPTVRGQNVRGIEASRIRLGIVQPGENIANFNDALNTLTTSLAYLYANPTNDRFWYDTRPTLRKTVADRATQIAASDVEFEIENRLRKLKKETPFAAVHICPASSLDVPDEQSARLVILPPKDGYKASNPQNAAQTLAADILNNRGNTPRIYRNMLAFVAPDQELVNTLNHTARVFLAWRSIQDDSEELNLDNSQNKEIARNLAQFDRSVTDQLREAYCWLLVPGIDRFTDMKTIVWDANRISGGTETVVGKAAKKMLQNEQIIKKWAPALLLMELDNLLWHETDSLQVKKLWEYLCTYCYLPRLANEGILLDAIQEGVKSGSCFAYAAGLNDGRWMDLKCGQSTVVDRSGYLVKLPAAQKQMEEDAAKQESKQRTHTNMAAAFEQDDTFTLRAPLSSEAERTGTAEPSAKQEPENTHFYMSAALDSTRIGRDIERLVEEVVSHLLSVSGAQVDVALEVNVHAPEGFTQQTIRTVSENCQTLRIRNFEFGK